MSEFLLLHNNNLIQNVSAFTKLRNELSNQHFRVNKGTTKNGKLFIEQFIQRDKNSGEIQDSNKYKHTCQNKKFCFEMTMSDKLSMLRGKISKKFWNLLTEGFKRQYIVFPLL